MEAEILYREVVGDGDDTEEGKNGIVVTLSHWTTTTDYARNHYLLESRVMIDRDLVVDECELYFFQALPKMIRKAVAKVDQLLELSPECVPYARREK